MVTKTIPSKPKPSKAAKEKEAELAAKEDKLTPEEEAAVREHEMKIQEIRDRIKRMSELNRMKGNVNSDDSYQAYFDEPAYARRKKKIQNDPRSQDSNLSRYNLNDDDEIVGNNRFFDDNVD